MGWRRPSKICTGACRFKTAELLGPDSRGDACGERESLRLPCGRVLSGTSTGAAWRGGSRAVSEESWREHDGGRVGCSPRISEHAGLDWPMAELFGGGVDAERRLHHSERREGAGH